MKEWLSKFSKRWPSTTRKSRTVEKPIGSDTDGAKLKWILAIILGVGAGLIGPYTTYLLYETPVRIGYWIIVALLSFGIWEIFELILNRFSRIHSFLLRRVLIVPPFALVNSAALVGIHISLSAFGARSMTVSWFDLVLSHLVLSSLVILPAIVVVEHMRVRLETQAGSEAISFLTEKLPMKLRGTKPFALAAEGHYVRVYTPNGEALITMRFEDAVRAVVGIAGYQTHRSWWLALENITEIKTSGSAYEAVLKTGLIVPVSRRRKAQLSDALKAQIFS